MSRRLIASSRVRAPRMTRRLRRAGRKTAETGRKFGLSTHGFQTGATQHGAVREITTTTRPAPPCLRCLVCSAAAKARAAAEEAAVADVAVAEAAAEEAAAAEAAAAEVAAVEAAARRRTAGTDPALPATTAVVPSPRHRHVPVKIQS